MSLQPSPPHSPVSQSVYGAASPRSPQSPRSPKSVERDNDTTATTDVRRHNGYTYAAPPAPSASVYDPRTQMAVPITFAPANGYAPPTNMLIAMATDQEIFRTRYTTRLCAWQQVYAFPTVYPALYAPVVANYMSSQEWSASIANINRALEWSVFARILSVLLAVGVLFGIFVAFAADNDALAWLGVFIAFLFLICEAALFRFYSATRYLRLIDAVQSESDYYNQNARRSGVSPCRWDIQYRDLVISAPVTQATPHYQQAPLTAYTI